MVWGGDLWKVLPLRRGEAFCGVPWVLLRLILLLFSESKKDAKSKKIEKVRRGPESYYFFIFVRILDTVPDAAHDFYRFRSASLAENLREMKGSAAEHRKWFKS